jgi:rhodanese-related sulfurtransferase
LAAASLADLGYARAADLIGGYRAWHAWFASDAGAERRGSSV